MADTEYNVTQGQDGHTEGPGPVQEEGDPTGAPPDRVGGGPLELSSDGYLADSESYRDGGMDAEPGTGASSGYLGDSERYSNSEASPYPDVPADLRPRDQSPSGQAYPGKRRNRMEPRSGWLREIDFVGDGQPVPEEPMERQVNVRLDSSRYRDLCRAADLYGVAPTTMARMLLRRGVLAVLDERRRDDHLHGGPD